jgi:Xaa-Pro aminopeptidase
VAFPVVVAAGPNGARPTQYRHGSRSISAGEPVVLDFGGVFDHYPSDQTRTVVFEGEPPAPFPEIHGIVKDALEAGLAAAEPGTTAAELDRVVREVIEDRGYGEQFVTGTGHGVGIRAHEPPSIAPGDRTTLEADMVFSLEPGIYLEGRFGVRLETLVVLTDEGADPLNTSPYDWRPP